MWKAKSGGGGILVIHSHNLRNFIVACIGDITASQPLWILSFRGYRVGDAGRGAGRRTGPSDPYLLSWRVTGRRQDGKGYASRKGDVLVGV